VPRICLETHLPRLNRQVRVGWTSGQDAGLVNTPPRWSGADPRNSPRRRPSILPVVLRQ